MVGLSELSRRESYEAVDSPLFSISRGACRHFDWDCRFHSALCQKSAISENPNNQCLNLLHG
jgi:hypothetical protein